MFLTAIWLLNSAILACSVTIDGANSTVACPAAERISQITESVVQSILRDSVIPELDRRRSNQPQLSLWWSWTMGEPF